MARFVGREAEIGRLDALLAQVRAGGEEPGRAISIRGRRRVGKSRMVAEFARRAEVPYVHFNASHGSTAHELARFEAEVGRSTLPDRDLFVAGFDWEATLRSLALVLPRDTPSVVVIDEVPYLTREDPTFEGALQSVWDRVLSRLPVLLILVGSNRAEMERLTSYDRPFYMRGTELELGPLTVSDVAAMTGLGAADAVDAYVVTGGLPLVLREFPRGASVEKFLADAVANPLSALLVSGERMVTAELPAEANARVVLESIGSGETTYGAIANAAGLSESTLLRSLELLVDRRLVVVDRPLSTKGERNTRYRIEDPYLRFWLAFLADQIPVVESGRADVVLDGIRRRWSGWRGRAVEPVIRDLLWRSRDLLPADAAVVGSWWNRSNSVEVDVVGADRAPVARSIAYVGSIKWRENKPFTAADGTALAASRSSIPGAAEAPLVAVSRAGSEASLPGLTAVSPEALLAS